MIPQFCSIKNYSIQRLKDPSNLFIRSFNNNKNSETQKIKKTQIIRNPQLTKEKLLTMISWIKEPIFIRSTKNELNKFSICFSRSVLFGEVNIFFPFHDLHAYSATSLLSLASRYVPTTYFVQKPKKNVYQLITNFKLIYNSIEKIFVIMDNFFVENKLSSARSAFLSNLAPRRARSLKYQQRTLKKDEGAKFLFRLNKTKKLNIEHVFQTKLASRFAAQHSELNLNFATRFAQLIKTLYQNPKFWNTKNKKSIKRFSNLRSMSKIYKIYTNRLFTKIHIPHQFIKKEIKFVTPSLYIMCRFLPYIKPSLHFNRRFSPFKAYSTIFPGVKQKNFNKTGVVNNSNQKTLKFFNTIKYFGFEKASQHLAKRRKGIDRFFGQNINNDSCVFSNISSFENSLSNESLSIDDLFYKPTIKMTLFPLLYRNQLKNSFNHESINSFASQHTHFPSPKLEKRTNFEIFSHSNKINFKKKSPNFRAKRAANISDNLSFREDSKTLQNMTSKFSQFYTIFSATPLDLISKQNQFRSRISSFKNFFLFKRLKQINFSAQHEAIPKKKFIFKNKFKKQTLINLKDSIDFFYPFLSFSYNETGFKNDYKLIYIENGDKNLNQNSLILINNELFQYQDLICSINENLSKVQILNSSNKFYDKVSIIKVAKTNNNNNDNELNKLNSKFNWGENKTLKILINSKKIRLVDFLHQFKLYHSDDFDPFVLTDETKNEQLNKINLDNQLRASKPNQNYQSLLNSTRIVKNQKKQDNLKYNNRYKNRYNSENSYSNYASKFSRKPMLNLPVSKIKSKTDQKKNYIYQKLIIQLNQLKEITQPHINHLGSFADPFDSIASRFAVPRFAQIQKYNESSNTLYKSCGKKNYETSSLSSIIKLSKLNNVNSAQRANKIYSAGLRENYPISINKETFYKQKARKLFNFNDTLDLNFKDSLSSRLRIKLLNISNTKNISAPRLAASSFASSLSSPPKHTSHFGELFNINIKESKTWEICLFNKNINLKKFEQILETLNTFKPIQRYPLSFNSTSTSFSFFLDNSLNNFKQQNSIKLINNTKYNLGDLFKDEIFKNYGTTNNKQKMQNLKMDLLNTLSNDSTTRLNNIEFFPQSQLISQNKSNFRSIISLPLTSFNSTPNYKNHKNSLELQKFVNNSKFTKYRGAVKREAQKKNSFNKVNLFFSKLGTQDIQIQNNISQKKLFIYFFNSNFEHLFFINKTAQREADRNKIFNQINFLDSNSIKSNISSKKNSLLYFVNKQNNQKKKSPQLEADKCEANKTLINEKTLEYFRTKPNIFMEISAQREATKRRAAKRDTDFMIKNRKVNNPTLINIIITSENFTPPSGCVDDSSPFGDPLLYLSSSLVPSKIFHTQKFNNNFNGTKIIFEKNLKIPRSEERKPQKDISAGVKKVPKLLRSSTLNEGLITLEDHLRNRDKGVYNFDYKKIHSFYALSTKNFSKTDKNLNFKKKYIIHNINNQNKEIKNISKKSRNLTLDNEKNYSNSIDSKPLKKQNGNQLKFDKEFFFNKFEDNFDIIFTINSEGKYFENKLIANIQKSSNFLIKPKTKNYFLTTPIKPQKNIFNQEIPFYIPPAIPINKQNFFIRISKNNFEKNIISNLETMNIQTESIKIKQNKNISKTEIEKAYSMQSQLKNRFLIHNLFNTKYEFVKQINSLPVEGDGEIQFNTIHCKNRKLILFWNKLLKNNNIFQSKNTSGNLLSLDDIYSLVYNNNLPIKHNIYIYLIGITFKDGSFFQFNQFSYMKNIKKFEFLLQNNIFSKIENKNLNLLPKQKKISVLQTSNSTLIPKMSPLNLNTFIMKTKKLISFLYKKKKNYKSFFLDMSLVGKFWESYQTMNLLISSKKKRNFFFNKTQNLLGYKNFFFMKQTNIRSKFLPSINSRDTTNLIAPSSLGKGSLGEKASPSYIENQNNFNGQNDFGLWRKLNSAKRVAENLKQKKLKFYFENNNYFQNKFAINSLWYAFTTIGSTYQKFTTEPDIESQYPIKNLTKTIPTNQLKNYQNLSRSEKLRSAELKKKNLYILKIKYHYFEDLDPKRKLKNLNLLTWQVAKLNFIGKLWDLNSFNFYRQKSSKFVGTCKELETVQRVATKLGASKREAAKRGAAKRGATKRGAAKRGANKFKNLKSLTNKMSLHLPSSIIAQKLTTISTSLSNFKKYPLSHFGIPSIYSKSFISLRDLYTQYFIKSLFHGNSKSENSSELLKFFLINKFYSNYIQQYSQFKKKIQFYDKNQLNSKFDANFLSKFEFCSKKLNSIKLLNIQSNIQSQKLNNIQSNNFNRNDYKKPASRNATPPCEQNNIIEKSEIEQQFSKFTMFKNKQLFYEFSQTKFFKFSIKKYKNLLFQNFIFFNRQGNKNNLIKYKILGNTTSQNSKNNIKFLLPFIAYKLDQNSNEIVGNSHTLIQRNELINNSLSLVKKDSFKNFVSKELEKNLFSCYFHKKKINWQTNSFLFYSILLKKNAIILNSSFISYQIKKFSFLFYPYFATQILGDFIKPTTSIFFKNYNKTRSPLNFRGKISNFYQPINSRIIISKSGFCFYLAILKNENNFSKKFRTNLTTKLIKNEFNPEINFFNDFNLILSFDRTSIFFTHAFLAYNRSLLVTKQTLFKNIDKFLFLNEKIFNLDYTKNISTILVSNLEKLSPQIDQDNMEFTKKNSKNYLLLPIQIHTHGQFEHKRNKNFISRFSKNKVQLIKKSIVGFKMLISNKNKENIFKLCFPRIVRKLEERTENSKAISDFFITKSFLFRRNKETSLGGVKRYGVRQQRSTTHKDLTEAIFNLIGFSKYYSNSTIYPKILSNSLIKFVIPPKFFIRKKFSLIQYKKIITQLYDISQTINFQKLIKFTLFLSPLRLIQGNLVLHSRLYEFSEEPSILNIQIFKPHAPHKINIINKNEFQDFQKAQQFNRIWHVLLLKYEFFSDIRIGRNATELQQISNFSKKLTTRFLQNSSALRAKFFSLKGRSIKSIKPLRKNYFNLKNSPKNLLFYSTPKILNNNYTIKNKISKKKKQFSLFSPKNLNIAENRIQNIKYQIKFQSVTIFNLKVHFKEKFQIQHKTNLSSLHGAKKKINYFKQKISKAQNSKRLDDLIFLNSFLTTYILAPHSAQKRVSSALTTIIGSTLLDFEDMRNLKSADITQGVPLLRRYFDVPKDNPIHLELKQTFQNYYNLLQSSILKQNLKNSKFFQKKLKNPYFQKDREFLNKPDTNFKKLNQRFLILNIAGKFKEKIKLNLINSIKAAKRGAKKNLAPSLLREYRISSPKVLSSRNKSYPFVSLSNFRLTDPRIPRSAKQFSSSFGNSPFRPKARFSRSLALRSSMVKILQKIVNNVQWVYRSQGVEVYDQHIEIIASQIGTKVRIKEDFDTKFFWNEIVPFHLVQNSELEYEPVLVGITKVSLQTDSFISAASFQSATKVLTRESIQKKKDFILGLKESIIVGQMIPAGTGIFSFGISNSTNSFKKSLRQG